MKRWPAAIGVALASGATAAWINRAGLPPLMDATGCPGLLELAATLTASARPTQPIAAALLAWDAAAAVAAAALLSLAVWRFTASLTAAAGLGVVAAASPLLAPSIAPPGVSASLAIAAGTWIAVLSGDRVVSVAAVVAGLALASAVAPSLTIPAALLCWLVARRRSSRVLAIAAVAVPLTAVAVVALSVPALPGQPTNGVSACVVPDVVRLGEVIGGVAATVGSVGPLLDALAVLGLFTILTSGPSAHPPLADGAATLGLARGARVLLWGWPAAAAVATASQAADPARALAPLLVTLWLVGGVGLGEVSRRAGSAWRRSAVAAAMLGVLVFVHAMPRIRAQPSAAAPPVPLGHSDLSRRDIVLLLSRMPAGAALVSEDAVTDVLLRSIGRDLGRAGISVAVLPRTPEAIAAALATKPVVLLPRAQGDLQVRGVELGDESGPVVPGAARAIRVVPCAAATESWQPVQLSGGTRTFALVSDDESARGPLEIYVGGPEPMETRALEWPRLARRGLYADTYDRSRPDEREALAAESSGEGTASDAPAITAPHVSRVGVWRVPGAPLALAIEFSTPPSAVLIRQRPGTIGSVRLCHSFPFAVRSLDVGGLSLR